MPAGDLATTKIFTNGQLGVDGVDLNQIMQLASVQTAFYTAQSAGSSPGDSDLLLLLSAGGGFYKILYQNLFKNTKWVQQAIGLPLYNAIINGDMKVWQWGTTDTNAASGDYLADHWVIKYVLGGGGKINLSQIDQTVTTPQLTLPNGYSVRYALRAAVNTIQASLAATDFAYIAQPVELSEARKLFQGATSAQIYVKANAAGTYTFFVQNAAGTETYKQDFVIGTPNVWQQLTLPNIPVFPSQSSGWGTAETDLAYIIGICFACGSNFQSAGQSTWAANNFLGSASTSNFLATLTNTLDLCICQHEPGAVCTYFQPEPMSDTVNKCRRYALAFNGDFIGTVNQAGGGADVGGSTRFPVQMRAAPTLVAGASFSASSGANGTPHLLNATQDSVEITNSGTAWSGGVAIKLTGFLKAELI